MSGYKSKQPRVVVGIATVDRGDLVATVVRKYSQQDSLPDQVFVSGVSKSDFGDLPDIELPFSVKLLTGSKGSCAQRNLIISHLEKDDILLIVDDDFLPAPDFISKLRLLMREHPEIVIATGKVLADGILGPGMNVSEGESALESGLKLPQSASIKPVRNGYGCNMAVRASTVLEHGIRFDEALPLYGWFEDVDFSSLVAAHGQVVQADQLRGVHLGTKTGRTPGKKFGYSQIANIVYLRRKGTLSGKDAMIQMSRNVLSNLHHSIFPVEWADHKGRLRGNFTAFADLVRRRCDPRRILDF